MMLIDELNGYVPYNEQENADKEIILNQLNSDPLIFQRDNKLSHITVSAWVVNKTHDKVLFAFHNIYKSWAWLGGHADGEKDLLAVAVREAKEESGIKSVLPLCNDFFSLEILPVSGHIKNGKYVSSHTHLNFTYLLEADENEPLSVKTDENSGVAWLGFSEVLEKSDEEWIKETIYIKIIRKMENI